MAAYPQEMLDKAKALHDAGVSVKAIAEQLNIRPERLYEWRIKGWKRTYVPTDRPMPDDFTERCQVENIDDMSKSYRASPTTIRKWLVQMPPEIMEARLRNLGVVTDSNGRTKKVGRPAPQDFESVYLRLSPRETATHYAVHEKQIDRWLRNLPHLRAKRREMVKNSRTHLLSRLQRFGPQITLTTVDSAAHFLRRFKSQVYAPAKVLVCSGQKGGMAIYRPMGPEGYHYVEGKGYIHTEEMLEMARSYGWQS